MMGNLMSQQIFWNKTQTVIKSYRKNGKNEVNRAD